MNYIPNTYLSGSHQKVWDATRDWTDLPIGLWPQAEEMHDAGLLQVAVIEPELGEEGTIHGKRLYRWTLLGQVLWTRLLIDHELEMAAEAAIS